MRTRFAAIRLIPLPCTLLLLAACGGSGGEAEAAPPSRAESGSREAGGASAMAAYNVALDGIAAALPARIDAFQARKVELLNPEAAMVADFGVANAAYEDADERKLDATVSLYTGKAEAEEAWRRLYPEGQIRNYVDGVRSVEREEVEIGGRQGLRLHVVRDAAHADEEALVPARMLAVRAGERCIAQMGTPIASTMDEAALGRALAAIDLAAVERACAVPTGRPPRAPSGRPAAIERDPAAVNAALTAFTEAARAAGREGAETAEAHALLRILPVRLPGAERTDASVRKNPGTAFGPGATIVRAAYQPLEEGGPQYGIMITDFGRANDALARQIALGTCAERPAGKLGLYAGKHLVCENDREIARGGARIDLLVADRIRVTLDSAGAGRDELLRVLAGLDMQALEAMAAG